MSMYEINALMRNAHYRNKDDWEQARLIAYLVAQTNSTKKLKLSDIIEFPWEQLEKKDTHISIEDVERLSRQAAELEKMFAAQKK